MKHFFYLFVFLAFISSCRKDDDPTVTRGKATFEIGSAKKVFTKANSFNNGVLALGNTTDEVVTLFFPIPSTFPTTYDMDSEEIVSAAYLVDGITYNATNGILGVGQKGAIIITITDYSSAKISGTFQFTALSDDNEEISITNDVFDKIPDL